MITGCLQQKNGFYYAVLYLKVNGRRRCKWVPMRLPVEGTSARKAQKAFDEIRLQYEREEEERLDREAKAKELAENTHPDALLPFTEYMEKWLQSTRSSLATATYQSYSNMYRITAKCSTETLILATIPTKKQSLLPSEMTAQRLLLSSERTGKQRQGLLRITPKSKKIFSLRRICEADISDLINQEREDTNDDKTKIRFYFADAG